jgi:hypothetical protein
MQIIHVIDDFDGAEMTEGEAIYMRGMALQALEDLGFLIKWVKTPVKPLQQMVFLGFEVNGVTHTLRVLPEKLDAFERELQSLLSHNTITPHQVASIYGKLSSMRQGCGIIPFYMLEGRRALRNWYDKPLYAPQEIPAGMTQELLGAVVAIRNTAPRRIARTDFLPSVDFWVDASLTGWGATFRLPPPKSGPDAKPIRWFSEEEWGAKKPAILNIQGYRELEAVRRALCKYGPQLHHHHIFLREDNTNVVSWVTKWKPPLPDNPQDYRCVDLDGQRILRHIYDLVDQHDLELTPIWVKSKDNIADCLSRMTQERRQLYLHDSQRRALCDRFWGDPEPQRTKPVLELFAFPNHTWCEHFCTRFAWEEAHGDAFKLEAWDGPLWVFPPPRLANAAFELIRKLLPTIGENSAIFIVPDVQEAYTPTLERVSRDRFALVVPQTSSTPATSVVAFHLEPRYAAWWTAGV